MEKVVRDGKVAVLFSPDFGAGWFTWNENLPECLFNPEIVALVEAEGTVSAIESLANSLWPGGYWGGAKGLQIKWLPEGESFQLEEYDGSESFRFRDSAGWHTA